MADGRAITPGEIRAARQENPKAFARDLASAMGLAEAELVAAETGHDATRISADPDRIMPLMPAFGEVMALTRNDSAVIEKTGQYGDYTPGAHAAMVLSPEIDLRIFPKHWVHAFALKEQKGPKLRRSIQIFDAAGDAVHKIHVPVDTPDEVWDGLVADLSMEDQSQVLDLFPRAPVEPTKADPAKTDRLRSEWDRLTDTHQFLQMVRKLKMNRLGAYRIAGAPYVRPLAHDCIGSLLDGLSAARLPFMLFVGNSGCIEIHSGPIDTTKPTGAWLNILDPRFNLHLRGDHVAEVWAVSKPTRRGPTLSVEAFDAAGRLILQAFGLRTDNVDHMAPWVDLVGTLPEPAEAPL
ncbi:Hemin transport protein (plasmid) [Rhodovulum sp. P5]|uniref:hemin-degrading factor n=1 Tax=Rhodovulum sp. P5 TaxID=1564506 RepID=UPI0009C29597|nr:ChuX/HutX family heme-like substrate-binding protein [Rhodovulum sp. P5]ARE42426.1 Hemin transport protein [Rhodovulum sp. P5]